MCARTPRIGLRLLLARCGIVDATGLEVTGACRGSRLELGLSFSQLLQKKRREQRDSQHEHDDHSPEHHGAPPEREDATYVPLPILMVPRVSRFPGFSGTGIAKA